jgi:hypothetical protein
VSITVKNNSDGSFTITCGTETVTVGGSTAPTTSAPAARARGRRGGFVVTSIVDAKLPHGTETVHGTKELMSKLKTAASQAALQRATGHAGVREVHFRLKGSQTLDMSKVTPIIGGEKPSILAHIHFDPGHD